MTVINPQAEALNQILENDHPPLSEMLSQRGKAIFFPKKGLLSQAQEAKGQPINATVGIGLDDDGLPMRLPAIAEKIQLDPRRVFPYASSYGLPALRQAWKAQIVKKNPSLKAETSLPVVTNGLTHGLSMTGYLFVNEGDTVILPNVYWGNYRLVLRQNYGARFVNYGPFSGTGYNIQGFKSAVDENPGKQIVLLNFPHNPTGYSLTEAEGEAVIETLLASAQRGNKLVVVMDDAYFGLVYEKGILRESLFARLADAHENILAVKVDGATKEDYAWGFRVGFLTYAAKGMSPEGLKALEDKTAGAIRSNISSASHLSQSLILEALNSDAYDRDKTEKSTLLQRRYEKVVAVLKENSKKYSDVFETLPFNSGYFMCMKMKNGLTAEAVRQALLADHGIGVIATDDLVRVAFSSVPTDRIPEIFEAIYTVARA